MGEKKRKKEEPWMDIKTQKCVYKMYKIGLLEKDHKKKNSFKGTCGTHLKIYVRARKA